MLYGGVYATCIREYEIPADCVRDARQLTSLSDRTDENFHQRNLTVSSIWFLCIFYCNIIFISHTLCFSLFRVKEVIRTSKSRQRLKIFHAVCAINITVQFATQKDARQQKDGGLLGALNSRNQKRVVVL